MKILSIAPFAVNGVEVMFPLRDCWVVKGIRTFFGPHEGRRRVDCVKPVATRTVVAIPLRLMASDTLVVDGE